MRKQINGAPARQSALMPAGIIPNLVIPPRRAATFGKRTR